jgi:hypothetical protein
MWTSVIVWSQPPVPGPQIDQLGSAVHLCVILPNETRLVSTAILRVTLIQHDASSAWVAKYYAQKVTFQWEHIFRALTVLLF